MIEAHQAEVAQTLGRPDGVLTRSVDGCDFPKQGEDSVGVAWQHCGPLGKIANCQASVVLAYASQVRNTLLDRRLYLPKEWFDEAHQERWHKCGIPKKVTFQTKPALGWEMVEAVLQKGRVPFQWVAMDEGFARASKTLVRALNLAQPKGYVRLSLDEGAAMAQLLQAIVPNLEKRALATFATLLLRAFASTRAVQPAAAPLPASPLLEPLSPQEQRVLRLLAAGLSNPEIARELVVSTNTIKTQLQSIYRKLNVNNRDEAREMARELKLL